MKATRLVDSHFYGKTTTSTPSGSPCAMCHRLQILLLRTSHTRTHTKCQCFAEYMYTPVLNAYYRHYNKCEQTMVTLLLSHNNLLSFISNQIRKSAKSIIIPSYVTQMVRKGSHDLLRIATPHYSLHLPHT